MPVVRGEGLLHLQIFESGKNFPQLCENEKKRMDPFYLSNVVLSPVISMPVHTNYPSLTKEVLCSHSPDIQVS